MNPLRPLHVLTRTRARLACTLGLVLGVLLLGLLPLTPWGGRGQSSAADAAHGSGSGAAEPAGETQRPLDAADAMELARERDEPVVVDAETTDTSLTHALPDGQYRTEIAALPQRARTEDGDWADIDTTLRRTERGIQPVNSPTPLVFSPGSAGTGDDGEAPEAADRESDGDRGSRGVLRPHAALLPAARTTDTAEDEIPEEDRDNEPEDGGPGDPAAGEPHPGHTVLAEIGYGEHTVTYSWPGSLPEPVLDGPRALYPDVVPGVDLLLVAREEGGFGQLLIVKSAQAAADARSGDRLDLTAITYGLSSPTAVFRHDETTGGVHILDPDGEEIGAVPTPTGWDSGGLEPTDPTDPDAPAPPEPRTATATPQQVLRLTGLTGIEPGAAHAPIPTRLDGDDTSRALLRLDAAATGLFDAGADVSYPVFLDPTLNGGVHSWTIAYKPSPNTSFFNGTNYNNGTSEARVGYESQTRGLARSFWRMNFNKNLSGATISSATFRVRNTHSWSCETRQFQLWLTGAISSTTTWNKQPEWRTHQQNRSFAHGYSSSCPNEYVAYNIRNGAQQAADAGWATLTLGMRATTETSTWTWRKFQANSAQITVTYNRKPNEPTRGTSTPGGACSTTAGQVKVSKVDVVLAANATDPDGNLRHLYFRMWPSGNSANKIVDRRVTVNSAGRGSVTVLASQLVDGTTYSWDVRAEDTEGAVSTYFPPGTAACRITVDASAPPAPELSSPQVEDTPWDSGQWADIRYGTPVQFTLDVKGNKDTVRVGYAFNGVGYTNVTLPKPGDSLTVTLNPPNAGPVAFHAYAYDAVGNRSERAELLFYLPPRDEADGPGDINGDGHPDLLVINAAGELRSYAGEKGGQVFSPVRASYSSDGTISPPGHFYDPATDTVALISKHSDVYPGDGLTDLFVRTPDNGFWIYPGDGYGSFNVDDRIRVLLPDNAPAPSTWRQIKAVGDVTGDGLPDLFLRAGTSFWVLTGYTGASFQEARRLTVNSWDSREIVNIADIDLDGTPDLVWRNTTNGNLYVRHGLPGEVRGSVDLTSLMTAARSRDGDIRHATGWSAAARPLLVGIPDTSGDRRADIWALDATGEVRIYHPTATGIGDPVATVRTGWGRVRALG
ncbi:FG-GAP-like repeat-containing protein [Streptomyces bohaiensis]|uniref:FG-GAP-like repeat-containing protein n=1 Tax=Streptomyces bohaiensis TaxID=1431344 RepID=UPI003B7DA592